MVVRMNRPTWHWPAIAAICKRGQTFLVSTPSPIESRLCSILAWTGGTATFACNEARIEGTTSIGRATVRVLTLNHPRRLDLRQELFLRGEFP